VTAPAGVAAERAPPGAAAGAAAGAAGGALVMYDVRELKEVRACWGRACVWGQLVCLWCVWRACDARRHPCTAHQQLVVGRVVARAAACVPLSRLQVRRIGMPSHVAAIKWQPRINQIFLGVGERACVRACVLGAGAVGHGAMLLRGASAGRRRHHTPCARAVAGHTRRCQRAPTHPHAHQHTPHRVRRRQARRRHARAVRHDLQPARRAHGGVAHAAQGQPL
jgi:hypothetical protein